MKNRSPLSSLLTLAAGASALPFTADAAIVHTTLGPQTTVGFGAGQLTVFDISLPGTAKVEFSRSVGTSSTTPRILAHQSGGYVRIGRQSNHRSDVIPGIGGANVAFRTNAGANWNNVARTGISTSANIIRSVNSGTAATTGPGAFSNKYLLFSFKNSLKGNQIQYGWVGMSAATVTAGDSTKMSVTLTDWAYEDTGLKINAGAGAVPEPTVASLMMAAMVVGGAALRRRPKSQPAASGRAN